MSERLDVDPGWAWDHFNPAGGVLTRRDLGHLSRRTCWGNSPEWFAANNGRNADEVVDELLAETPEQDPLQPEFASLAQATLATGDPKKLSAWWVYVLLGTRQPFREVMTLFWHGRFATSAAKVTNVNLMFRQNQLLRKEAFGDFGQMAMEISRDPAMLIYLDSVTNRKSHPNENYARELMELFCLGEGHYSETDIRELARCFTGWEVRREQFRLNSFQHDSGEKTVLGQSGRFDGEQGVGIVLEQETLPPFVIGKILKELVADDVEFSPDLVEPLSRQFRENGLQVRPLLKTILSSNLFYSSHCQARKIRSPVGFAMGLLRSLEGTANTILLASGLADLGQELFFPPNVKGWDGGRTWINSSTMLGRANLARRLLNDGETRFRNGTLDRFLSRQGKHSAAEIVEFWENMLLAVPLSAGLRDHLAGLIDRGSGDREKRLRDALHVICSLPEFQLA